MNSSMNDKQYLTYPESGNHQIYSTQFPVLPGTFSPTGTITDIYSTLISSNTSQRSQKPQESSCNFSDLPSWESFKLPEKIDLIEISSKDLSPGSYCSNLDTILPLENSISSQYVGRYDGQWYNTNTNLNCGQKSGDFSSCAQVGKYYNDCTKNSYCTLQKGSLDSDFFKSSCAYYNDPSFNQNELYKNKQDANPTVYGTNSASYYDPKYTELLSDSCLYQNSALSSGIPSLSEKISDAVSGTETKINYNLNYIAPDQHTEASNDDESDIIVEDSSSDGGSEELEKRVLYETTKCIICNTVYTPLGLQFYFLTSENPLTMSSQTPVLNRIIKILGNNFGPKSFLCNDCLGLINSIDHLEIKLESFHNELLQKFRKTSLENSLEIKIPTANKKDMKYKRYRCKFCKKILCFKTYIGNHIKRHKCRGFLCELCGKIAPSFKRLKYHLKNHKKKNIKMISSFKCSNNDCDKIFRTKSNLKEHENFCLGILPFKCKNQNCNKKFASASKLKNHTKLKHDKKFVAICSICNIGFVKLSDYKSHKITHSTDKKFSCPKCDKHYKTLSNLNFHLKSHEKNLPFTCNICQKGFMRKEYLEAHINNHNGIKNFSCSACDKKFVSQKNLDSHLKYHEGGVKTNTCNICGKVITSGFEEHLRVHSNLKEFECDKCEMRFNTKNTLAKHKKRKHISEKNISTDSI